MINFKDLVQYVPETFTIKHICDNQIMCLFECGSLCNGSSIFKETTFYDDGTWDLSVSGKTVYLNSIHVNNTFTVQKESILGICSAGEKLQLCERIEVTKNVIDSRFHT